MTPELSNFAARLREFVAERDRSPVAADASSERGPNFRSPFSLEPAADGDRPRSEKEFDALALELFALQFTHNAAYRKLCEARRIWPQSITHWTQILAVPAAAFKELELTCLMPAERAHVFHSSGTTEQRPSRHFHSAESLALYEASLWPWFLANVAADVRRLQSSGGSQPDEPQTSQSLLTSAATWRIAILTPPPTQTPDSSLVHMFETVRRELGASPSAFVGSVGHDGSWTLDFDAALTLLQGSRRREEAERPAAMNPPPHVAGYARPLVLLGTAFSFVHLLDFLAEQNLHLNLPLGSRVMETGGYKGRSRSLPKAELHALIMARLGIPASHIICEYGMSELSSQAYDWIARDGPTPDPSQEGNRPELPSYGGVGGGFEVQSSRRFFRFPPWTRTQIISPETGREVADGETGLIRVFDLANVFSVMAIQTEDLGIRRGNGFELIGRSASVEPRGCSLMAV